MNKKSSQPAQPSRAPAPISADPIELRAADKAAHERSHRVTDTHRKAAFEEMQRTAPKTPEDEDASH